MNKESHAERDGAGVRSFALESDKKANEERCQRYGSASNDLQYKWRDPNTIPDKFDMGEAEAAILDAFISQGPAQVWSGDGSSCAAQIVDAVWRKFAPSPAGLDALADLADRIEAVAVGFLATGTFGLTDIDELRHIRDELRSRPAQSMTESDAAMSQQDPSFPPEWNGSPEDKSS